MKRKEIEFCHTIQVSSVRDYIVFQLTALCHSPLGIHIQYREDEEDTYVLGEKDIQKQFIESKDSRENDESLETEHNVNFYAPLEEDDSTTRKRPIEEDLQEISIESKGSQENEEGLEAKHAIYVKKVLENYLILMNIVDYVSFEEIQRLRKVSRDIRQRIDRIKPDPLIKTCWFEIENLNVVNVRMNTYWNVSYKKNRDGCIVRNKYIPEDYRTRSLKDFEINIKHCTSGLDVLRINLPCLHSNRSENLESSVYPFLETFEELFKTRAPIKVKRLEMNLIRKTTTGLQQNEVMKVLPFLDSKKLETIQFSIRDDEGAENRMEVDEISKLSQWMNAKELIIKNCIILTPIQEMNITHFAKGDITVKTISLEDLRYLKEGFQNSTTLEKLKISFEKCSFNECRNDDIYQFMGVPHFQALPFLRNQRSVWFCRMSNCDNVLHIVHYVGRCIIFASVGRSQVPEEAWIHD